jgi:hypothetical protein
MHSNTEPGAASMSELPIVPSPSSPSFHSVRLVRHGVDLHAVQPRSFSTHKAAQASARALARRSVGALVVKLFADTQGEHQICIVASFGPGLSAIPTLQ